ncbi:hypothetical protein BD560DRAFT_423655 [Blakeslea trispora]|nr:hypothetical protein BD560DRAFT_423655 [Blakeslea trispora]
MPLFKIRTKSKVTSDFNFTPPTEVKPVQNAYSSYNRMDSPTSTLQDIRSEAPSYYSRSYIHHQQDKCSASKKRSRGNQDIEKNLRHWALDEFQKDQTKEPIYLRYCCCCCFPCLPAWTRTFCCFLLMAIIFATAFMAFLLLSFRSPQILFVGQDTSVMPNASNILNLQYSIFNANFFELNFDNVKTVTYYPTINRTTISTGKLHNVHLLPQMVTNITFPMKMTTSKLSDNSTDVDTDVLQELFETSCQDVQSDRPIEINFDIMATFSFRSSPIITFALTGQKTTLSCERCHFD